MNIKISGFRSSLNYNDNLNTVTGDFIRSIESQLGSPLISAELNDYDCDLKLIFIQSGGSEGLFLQNLNQLKEPYYLLTNGSNNSLAASLEIMTYCNLNNKKGEVIHGDINYIVDRIKTLALISKVKKELAHTRFGVIGRPSDWLISSVPSYETASDKLGVTFEDISLEEVKEEYNRVVMVDTAKLPAEFPTDEKIKALRTYKALKAIVDRHNLSGYTVRCFDLLGPLQTTGCVGLSLLNDAGITSTCEGDIAALISMHIAHILTGEGCFQANPSRIYTSDNEIVFAHCTLPLSMTENYKLDTHFESGTGIAVKGYLREEDVTVLRISSDLKNYFVSNGRILKNLEEPDLCRTQIQVKLDKDVTEILKKPCGNHHIIFYGHHASEIESILGELL